MFNRAIRAAIAISLIGTGVCAPAQAPVAPAAKRVWNLGFQDSHCTITTGSADALGASFWMTPGDPEPTLYVVGPPELLPNYKGKITVELAPNGESFDVQAFEVARGKSRVLQVAGLTHKFSAAFARSNELTLVSGKSRTSIPIVGALKAFDALQQCITETLPGWGVDPKAFGALQQPPTEIQGEFWISGADYPADALRADWQGYLVVRLNVDATGDVTDCAVVVSSGWKSVDRLTCGKAIAWAKFHPAIGADGQPTPAIRTSGVVFRLEG